jgi:hypothetical protein
MTVLGEWLAEIHEAGEVVRMGVRPLDAWLRRCMRRQLCPRHWSAESMALICVQQKLQLLRRRRACGSGVEFGKQWRMGRFGQRAGPGEVEDRKSGAAGGDEC